MSITTWEELVAQPNVDWRVIVRINPSKDYAGATWTDAGGGVGYDIYSTPCEEIVVNAVTENGTEIPKKDSLALLDEGYGFFFDFANQTLYLRMIDGGEPDPDGDIIMVYCWKNFSTDPIIINNSPCRPTVKADSLPVLDVSVDDIVEGIYKFNFGSFTLINDGWWDTASCEYLWTNCRVVIYVGGEDLPYNLYRTVFVGRISDFFVTDSVVSISVKDIRVGTFAELPINKYWISNYPNLAEGDEGKVIPLIYGVKENVLPVCIDPTAGSGGKWKLQDGELRAITEVRKVGETTTVLTVSSDYTEDLANGELTLLCGLAEDEYILCDVEGFPTADGSLMIHGADIAYDLLHNYLNFIDDELDLTSFSDTNSIRTTELALCLDTEQSSREILQTIGRSISSFFTPTQDGKLAFVAYTSEIPDDVLVLRDEDFKTWQVAFDNTFLKSGVSIKYDRNPHTQEFKSYDRQNLEVYYKYRIHDTLSIETYIKNESDAVTYATGLLSLVSRPITTVSTNVGGKAFPYYPTKKVLITRERAAGVDGYFDEKVFRIKRIAKDFAVGKVGLVLLDDLQTMGEEYCTVCYNCQICNTQEDVCTSCFTCQNCFVSQATQCYNCVSCEYCNDCQVTYVFCADCYVCQYCYSCQVCNIGVVRCSVCQSCYSCDTCVSNETCTGCDTCDTCQICVSQEKCYVCDVCDTCQVGN